VSCARSHRNDAAKALLPSPYHDRARSKRGRIDHRVDRCNSIAVHVRASLPNEIASRTFRRDEPSLYEQVHQRYTKLERCRGNRDRRGSVELAIPREEGMTGALGVVRRVVTVSDGRGLERQPLLRCSKVRPLQLPQLSYFVHRQKGKQCEEPLHILVRGVDPILVVVIGWSPFRVEPHCTSDCLPHLLPGGSQNQGRDHGERLITSNPADQIDARQDIEPLVDPADLQGAVPNSVKMQKIIGLEQRVIQLDKIQPFPCHAFAIGAVLQELIDAEMDADVPQESEITEGCEPIKVVEHESSIVREVNESFELPAKTGNVCCDLFLSKEASRFRLPCRVTNQSGSAAHDNKRNMPSALKMRKHHDGHEVPEMQAGGSRIVSAVDSQGSVFELRVETGLVRYLLNESSFP